MQKFSRFLAVLVAILSIVFMGFAGVVTFGGPNWEARMEKVDGYIFVQTPGEPPTWQATRLADRQPLTKKSPVLAEVIAEAITDRSRVAQEELTRLEAEFPLLQQQAGIYTQAQYKDSDALRVRMEQMAVDMKAVQQQLAAAQVERDKIAVEVKKTEERIDSRRQDVYRLQSQYLLIEADIQRIQTNLVSVEEQIHLLEDDLDKALRREEGLNQQAVPQVASEG